MESRIKSEPSEYSAAQIHDYLCHISFPNPPSIRDIEEKSFECTVENLRTMTRLNRLTFPFENTAMHYSPEHVIHTSPQEVFDWMVTKNRGYGSHCCGLGILVLGVLRGLGYRAYPSLGQWNAALAQPEGYVPAPRAHMFLFVQTDLSPETFIVDCGGGPTGPVGTMILRDGEVLSGTAPPEEFRIVHRPPLEPPPANETNFEWMMEMRCGSFMPTWRVLFRFSFEPASTEEIESMNRFLTQRKESKMFWNDVFCVSYFFVDKTVKMSDPAAMEAHLGKLVLTGGKVSRRIGDNIEMLKEVKTERERVQALEEYFGVVIDEEDVVNIAGRFPQLPFDLTDDIPTNGTALGLYTPSESVQKLPDDSNSANAR
ncbi:cysteine proteinase [Schizopora paradoxa]|uniref:Cysteine proteinase n=1 Tax=Schizopora paradoxa TaxID=27342 RepID=A0A0H2S1W5_9AGAM|nr:cysteine proteinase [Schizopora paradoxa]